MGSGVIALPHLNRDPFTQFQRNPVTGRYIPSSLYSQFGGSIGGPIIKDKAFFFTDYQGTRQRTGTSLQQKVPTAQVRNTCLNAGSVTYDLSQYGGGVISNPLVTPQGRALLSALPAPNAGATGAIAVGGWQLAGITTWESGMPFTPTYKECGSAQDIDTNSGSPSASSDCRPNRLINGPGAGFALNTGSFNATTHSRRTSRR